MNASERGECGDGVKDKVYLEEKGLSERKEKRQAQPVDNSQQNAPGRIPL